MFDNKDFHFHALNSKNHSMIPDTKLAMSFHGVAKRYTEDFRTRHEFSFDGRFDALFDNAVKFGYILADNQVMVFHLIDHTHAA